MSRRVLVVVLASILAIAVAAVAVAVSRSTAPASAASARAHLHASAGSHETATASTNPAITESATSSHSTWPVATPGALTVPVTAGTPATTATAPAATSGVATGDTGVVAACDGSAATNGGLQQQPSSIRITCADGGMNLVHLVWESWTSTSATAAGTFQMNRCTPICATGTLAYYPATITVSGVLSTVDGPAFSVVTLEYARTAPVTRTGQPLDHFTLWYPGV